MCEGSVPVTSMLKHRGSGDELVRLLQSSSYGYEAVYLGSSDEYGRVYSTVVPVRKYFVLETSV
jgi:hypothetical protein